MKKTIDDLLREKMQGYQAAYKPEYWQQAQQGLPTWQNTSSSGMSIINIGLSALLLVASALIPASNQKILSQQAVAQSAATSNSSQIQTTNNVGPTKNQFSETAERESNQTKTKEKANSITQPNQKSATETTIKNKRQAAMAASSSPNLTKASGASTQFRGPAAEDGQHQENANRKPVSNIPTAENLLSESMAFQPIKMLVLNGQIPFSSPHLSLATKELPTLKNKRFSPSTLALYSAVLSPFSSKTDSLQSQNKATIGLGLEASWLLGQHFKLNAGFGIAQQTWSLHTTAITGNQTFHKSITTTEWIYDSTHASVPIYTYVNGVPFYQYHQNFVRVDSTAIQKTDSIAYDSTVVLNPAQNWLEKQQMIEMPLSFVYVHQWNRWEFQTGIHLRNYFILRKALISEQESSSIAKSKGSYALDAGFMAGANFMFTPGWKIGLNALGSRWQGQNSISKSRWRAGAQVQLIWDL